MSHAKPVEDRQRRNLPDPLTIEMDVDADGNAEIAVPGRPVPAIPHDLDLPDKLERAWVALWTAPVAQLLDEGSDMPVVERLFRLYKLDADLSEAIEMHMADYLNAMRETMVGERAVEYMTDKSRLDDKLFAARMRVASECRMLEAQIGISPKARLALGVALVVASGGAGRSHIDEANDPG